MKANIVFFERKAASATPWTKHLWVYDCRTNQHFTLKTRALKRSGLDDFVVAHCPEDRSRRRKAENFKRWSYDELAGRPGFNLDMGRCQGRDAL